MAAPIPASKTIELNSPEATHEFGRQLGAAVVPGQVIALRGELGAGKTTLTQGIAVGLGIHARVTSPTFTLINQYRPGTRRLLLVHIDTYRLGDDTTAAHSEASNLGLDEILNDATLPDAHSDGAIVVIEWAERIAAMLPPNTLYIHLTAAPNDHNARTATLMASSPEGMNLLELFARES